MHLKNVVHRDLAGMPARAGLAPLAATSLDTRPDPVGRAPVGNGQIDQEKVPAVAVDELGADRARHQVDVRVVSQVVSQVVSLAVDLMVRLAVSQDTNQRHKPSRLICFG